MDDVIELIDKAMARWGGRDLVGSGEAVDLLLDIRSAVLPQHKEIDGQERLPIS